MDWLMGMQFPFPFVPDTLQFWVGMFSAIIIAIIGGIMILIETMSDVGAFTCGGALLFFVAIVAFILGVWFYVILVAGFIAFDYHRKNRFRGWDDF
jgi:hypothetical protein